jgi:hypothetical protein
VNDDENETDVNDSTNLQNADDRPKFA